MALEQAAVDYRYGILSSQMSEASTQLAAELSRESTLGQDRAMREARVLDIRARRARLARAENRLCFARLDMDTGDEYYLGRIGLSSESGDRVLLDWRADAAAAFYQATPSSPMGAVRKRSLLLEGRKVVDLEDVLLDQSVEVSGQEGELVGTAALLAEVGRLRSGRMGAIVATIQAEQDRLIRSSVKGALVITGGPGTGKTVIALHRAAWILYAHRDRLRGRGVFILSPSSVFSRYVSSVLPDLGETQVVTSTAGQLYPGLETDLREEPDLARLKGDVRLAEVLARAVNSFQRVSEDLTVAASGHQVTVSASELRKAQSSALRSASGQHNAARDRFLRSVIDRLVDGVVAQEETVAWLGDAESLADLRQWRAEIWTELVEDPEVRRAVNLLWMPIDPQRLLTRLYSDPALRLAACEGVLTEEEMGLLDRPGGGRWTVDDAVLLDELKALTGVDGSEEAGRQRASSRDRLERVEFAQSYMEELSTLVSDEYDPVALAKALVTSESLAGVWDEAYDEDELVEQAAGDPFWEFGHVVVDEAQECSPMMWRAVFRRSSSGSLTVVGDLDQSYERSGSGGGWAEVFSQFPEGSVRVEELTVNYRASAHAMELASSMLRAAGRPAAEVSSLREGSRPVFVHASAGILRSLAEQIGSSARVREGGKVGVVLPRVFADGVDVAAVTAFLQRSLAPMTVASGVEGLDTQVGVWTADEVKGLEFDVVVVVRPTAMYDQSVSDLYVATTRATAETVVVYDEPSLPPGYGPAVRQLAKSRHRATSHGH